MDVARAREYTRWWILIGGWIVLLAVVIYAVAIATVGWSETFGESWGVYAYAALSFGAFTSPVVVFAERVRQQFKEGQQLVDDAISDRVPGGIKWSQFWAIIIGAPVLGTALVVAGGAKPDLDVLSTVAQIDAALTIAVLVEGRSAFHLVGIGGNVAEQATTRLAFLWTLMLGMALLLNGVIVAHASRAGVGYTWALYGSLGYGFIAAIASLLLLALSASRRLLGLDASERQHAEDGGPGVP